MRKDTKGMIIFVAGMFIVMCSVGGIEQTPGYLLEQCLAAVLGLGLMMLGTLKIRDSD